MRKVAGLILGVIALHAVVATGFPLFSVEAYYWLWGQYPAAGYFDHPPMVAWVSRLSFGWILGSPLAARSGPILLAALATWALYALAQSMAPARGVAWRMALLGAFAPIFFTNGVLIQPDNGLFLFMALTWLCFWRAAEQPDAPLRWGWWLGAGVAAGGALLSKFHAWVLLPPLWIFLWISPQQRRLLRTPGPWVALLVALLTVAPNLIWNAQHDWMNYRFQFHRSTVEQSRFDWSNPFLFLSAPLLTLSPLVYLGVLVAIARGVKLWRRERDPRFIFLLLAGIPLPLLLGLLSLGVTISLHWPAPGYPPLILLMLLLLERGDLATWAGPRFTRCMFAGCYAIVVVLVVVPFCLHALPAKFHLPFRRELVNTGKIHEAISGWPEIGARLRRLHDENLKNGPTYIFARTWHTAASLAFYSRLPRDVFALLSADAHNFEIWRQERGGLTGATGLMVFKKDPRNHNTLLKKYDKYYRDVDDLFAALTPLPSLLCLNDGTFEEFLGSDLPHDPAEITSEYLIIKGTGFKGRIIPDTKRADEDRF